MKKRTKQHRRNKNRRGADTLLRRKESAMEHDAEQWPNLVKLSESEDLRLEEPWQDIRGLEVYDINGEQIGSVEDLYVEREARHPLPRPRFLDVSAGGFLGIGKKHFLVPVEEVSRDVGEEDRVIINQPRDKVVGSPDFDPEEVPHHDFQRAIRAYYGHT